MKYMDARKTGASIVLTENFGARAEQLKMYQPDEAHKLLGILTDPAGTLTEQIKYMTEQSREWNSRMEGSLLSQ